MPAPVAEMDTVSDLEMGSRLASPKTLSTGPNSGQGKAGRYAASSK
jgi:hypothetical protein